MRRMGWIVLLLGAGLGPASAAELSVLLPGGPVNMSVTSYAEQRFAAVVRQKTDFSCGAAAVATLLTHHYGMPVDEAAVLDEVLRYADPETVRESGLSLLDLKSYLARHGYRAEGFRTTLDRLELAAVPAITLINTEGYAHFVVIRGLRDGQVLVADPALGNRILARDAFERIWSGILLVVTSHAEQGRMAFNLDRHWRLRPAAPVDLALLGPSLGAPLLSLPNRHFF